MIEIADARDPVRLSYVRAVLEDAGITHAVFDQGADALWPGAFRTRIMVADKDAWLARKTLEAADAELATDRSGAG